MLGLSANILYLCPIKTDQYVKTDIPMSGYSTYIHNILEQHSQTRLCFMAVCAHWYTGFVSL